MTALSKDLRPADRAHPHEGFSAATGGLGLRLDAVLDRWTGSRRIVRAVTLVSVDAAIAYRRAAGYADREAKAAVSESSIFRLASMTKPLVSAPALSLVEKSVLSLEDPVARWLPGLTPATGDGARPMITMRQLMTHTCGHLYSFLFGDDTAHAAAGSAQAPGGPAPTSSDNVERLASVPLYETPGTAWCYSPASDVLGAVIEVAPDLTLPEALAMCVTRPLGMVDTRFHVADADRLAVTYRDRAEGPVVMRGEGLHDPIGPSSPFCADRVLDLRACRSGGAGATRTALDFLRFLETLRRCGAPILEMASASRIAMHSVWDLVDWTEGPGWGFGLGAAVLLYPCGAGTPQSPDAWEWGGILGGHWFVDPAERLTVVVLTNTSVVDVIGAFQVEIRDAVDSVLDG